MEGMQHGIPVIWNNDKRGKGNASITAQGKYSANVLFVKRGKRRDLLYNLFVPGGTSMQLFYSDYLDNLKEIHNEIRAAILGLPQEALDWVPGVEMNSIAVLVVHLLGAERYWIGDVIASEPSGRDREAEFEVRGKTENELLLKLGEVEKYIEKALEEMSIGELEEKRLSPRNGREVTVGWALLHALKHTTLHAGHIQITRQAWGQRQSKE
jgi:uncharacterized damage-inducible protein DinB